MIFTDLTKVRLVVDGDRLTLKSMHVPTIVEMSKFPGFTATDDGWGFLVFTLVDLGEPPEPDVGPEPETRQESPISDQPLLEDVMRRLAAVAGGCSSCEYDEAEGGLYDHCEECRRHVTAEVWSILCGL